jgi:hypothetical protein
VPASNDIIPSRATNNKSLAIRLTEFAIRNHLRLQPERIFLDKTFTSTHAEETMKKKLRQFIRLCDCNKPTILIKVLTTKNVYPFSGYAKALVLSLTIPPYLWRSL